MSYPIMTPTDRTKKFSEIFNNKNDFLSGWKTSGLYEEGLIEDKNVEKTFFLLYARNGNSAIASLDENQFKYKVWSIIYQYGPTWEKKLEIQKTLRELNEEEITAGSKAINNLARNPSTAPSTNNTEELKTINEQTVNKYKRSKLEGYANLVDLLEDDVTKVYIERFKKLFATFVDTRPLMYISEEGE